MQIGKVHFLKKIFFEKGKKEHFSEKILIENRLLIHQSIF